MLQAGPLELDAGAARLYRRLGVELSEEAPKPRSQQADETARNEVAPPDGAGVTAKADEAPKPKAAPKRKATRRKKS
jgi:hypothetical protein